MPMDLGSLRRARLLAGTDLAGVSGGFPCSASGHASAALAIPAQGALVGQAVTFQWLAVLPGSNPLGVVTSGGLRVTIGQ
jgi:hypothetical protein